MRFMMLMIPDVHAWDSTDTAQQARDMARMGQYNNELKEAAVLIAVDGLQAPAKGTRVTFKDGTPTATDGPFAEAKEVLGGYWVLDVASKDEAVNWAKRVPARNDETVEVRQIQEFDEFPEALKAAINTFEGLPKR